MIAADPENDDAKRNLAEVYEILGETRKALNLVIQGELPATPPRVNYFTYCFDSDRCTWEEKRKDSQTEYSRWQSEHTRGIAV